MHCRTIDSIFGDHRGPIKRCLAKLYPLGPTPATNIPTFDSPCSRRGVVAGDEGVTISCTEYAFKKTTVLLATTVCGDLGMAYGSVAKAMGKRAKKATINNAQSGKSRGSTLLGSFVGHGQPLPTPREQRSWSRTDNRTHLRTRPAALSREQRTWSRADKRAIGQPLYQGSSEAGPVRINEPIFGNLARADTRIAVPGATTWGQSQTDRQSPLRSPAARSHLVVESIASAFTTDRDAIETLNPPASRLPISPRSAPTRRC